MNPASRLNRMRMCLFVLCVLGAVVGLALPAEAQTILKAPLASARLAWDAGAGADKHVVTCGEVTRDVLMPETSIAVSEMVPGPGTYDCSIYAENAFARQTAPNVPFPRFEAGNPPNEPVRQRLEVQ